MKTRKINKVYALLLIMLLSFDYSDAQNSTSNPLSMYALGEMRSQSSTVNSSMGDAGIGVATGDFLNVVNPASYSEIDSLNFMMDIGLDAKYSFFKSQGRTAKDINVNFSYLTLGWRVTNWLAAGIGVNPFSTVGYEIDVTENIEGTAYEYPLVIEGSGDISRAYATLALSPLENLSIGVKSSFLFGQKEQIQTHSLSAINIANIYNTTTDYFHNFYFELGAQYKLNLKSNTVVLGVIYTPQQYLVTKRDNYSYSSAGLVYESTEELKDNFIIPEEIGFGVSFKNEKNLLVAVDAGIQKWSSYKYSDLQSVQLKDKTYLRGGVEYTPSKNSIDGIFERITYRIGGKYEKSYLSVKGEQIDGKAVTFGFSVPIKGDASHIDAGFEIGQTGTISSRLVRENYVKFKLGFSLTDLWFQKSKYN